MRKDVVAEYERRRVAFDRSFARDSARSRVLVLAAYAAIAAVVWAIFEWRVHRTPGVWTAWPSVLAVILLATESRVARRALRMAQLTMWYRRGLARIDGTEPQTGLTGKAFEERGHLYERDLEVLGPDSLFGALATVRTAVGQEALAGALLQPGSAAEARGRQAAVRSLVDRMELLERVQSLGASRFDEARGRDFEVWLERGDGGFGRRLPYGLAGLTVAWMAALLVSFAGPEAWVEASRAVALVLLLVQAVLCWALQARIGAELSESVRLADQILVLRDGLRLLATEPFEAPLLQALQNRAGKNLGALRRLRWALVGVEQRGKGWFYLFSLLLGAGTQLGMLLSRWRVRYGAELRGWVATWGEFELLLALATYAREHPESAWPEIVEGKTVFEAEGMWHPLLARDKAVANDVSVGGGTAFLLISGSNMAGKSTLLRAMGCNAVLALAGAPVCAARMRVGPLRIGASLALVDSLAEGRSKFLTEMERLRDLVTLARGGRMLFLVDEILSGTNSEDRRAAAEAVVRALREAGAIGALSTHDLALTVLAEDAVLGGRNVHMASAREDDPLAFDYRLKDGVNRMTNGMAIVRMLGLEERMEAETPGPLES